MGVSTTAKRMEGRERYRKITKRNEERKGIKTEGVLRDSSPPHTQTNQSINPLLPIVNKTGCAGPVRDR